MLPADNPADTPEPEPPDDYQGEALAHYADWAERKAAPGHELPTAIAATPLETVIDQVAQLFGVHP